MTKLIQIWYTQFDRPHFLFCGVLIYCVRYIDAILKQIEEYSIQKLSVYQFLKFASIMGLK